MTRQGKVVSTVEQLVSAAEDRLILSGDLVSCSLRSQPDIPKFLRQPALMTAGGVLPRLKPGSPRLYVSAHEVVGSKPGAKVGFAVEGYLNWGFRQKDSSLPVVLIGGSEGATEQQLVVCVFAQGRLVEYEERQLPLSSSLDWADSLRALIDALKEKHPVASFHQAGPLPDWGVPNVAYIGTRPLEFVRFRVSRSDKLAPFFVIAPVAVLGLGVCAYTGAVGYGYYLYDQKVNAFQAAVNHPVVVKYGGLDDEALDLLGKQRTFMSRSRPVIGQFQEATRFINLLSEDSGIRLHSLAMATPTTTPSAVKSGPKFGLIVSAKSSGGTFLDEAADIMKRISNRTGYELRLDSKDSAGLGEVRTLKLDVVEVNAASSGVKP